MFKVAVVIPLWLDFKHYSGADFNLEVLVTAIAYRQHVSQTEGVAYLANKLGSMLLLVDLLRRRRAHGLMDADPQHHLLLNSSA